MKKLKRAVAAVLLLVLVLSALPLTAFAETGRLFRSNSIGAYGFWLSANANSVRTTFNFTYADGSAGYDTLGGYGNYTVLHYISPSGVKPSGPLTGKIAYCIEPGKNTTNDQGYTGTPAENSQLWTSKLTASQQQAIRLVALYGWPNGYKDRPNDTMMTNDQTAFQYQCATQILIWEITMGLRSPTAPFALTDSRLRDIYYSTSEHPAFSTAYDEIAGRIARHYVIPSFASLIQNQAPTYIMTPDSNGYSIQLTDTNGVLASDFSNFQTPEGITASRNGNTVTITATAAAMLNGDVEIKAIGRRLNASNLGQMIWTSTNQQTVTTFSEAPDPVPIHFFLSAPGSMTMTKTSTDNDVEGYCFKVYHHGVSRSWYGKSDSSGRIFVTGDAYATPQTKTYSFTNMTDGTYTFLEVLSKKGKDLVFPDSWRITVTRGGSTQFDHTYTADDFSTDPNGDCRLALVEITGLSGGGVMTMTINNRPSKAECEIVKQSDDGNVSGIPFTVRDSGNTIVFSGETDSDGKLTVPNLTVGETYAFTETVPANYVAEQRTQTLTIQAGANTLTFVNHPVVSLEIIKTSSDGQIEGLSFTVEQFAGETEGWQLLGTYQTDSAGKISLQDLTVGARLRITETVPENYICASENPQEITLALGTNRVRFENKPVVKLELIKTSDTGAVAGIYFTIERLQGSEYTTLGTYTTDVNGRIVLEDLTAGAQYRVTESVPEGYVGQTPPQVFVAQLGMNTIRFRNRLIRGSLRIVKVDRGTQTPLEGAGFRLYDRYGTQVDSGYTDANGELRFDNLPYGQYYYQEFDAPEGFLPDAAYYRLNITEDGAVIEHRRENSGLTGSITVYKTDERGETLSGVAFLLEYSVDGGKTWTPVSSRAANELPFPGSCASEGLEEGTLLTDKDGRAVFAGLSIDSQLGEILYRVTETSAKAGYRLLSEPVFEGSLSEDTEIEATFTVVNQPEFLMPATGAEGFQSMIIGLCVVGLVGLAAVFIIYRKGKKDDEE